MFAIILLSLFLGFMIAIGFWGLKKTKTLNDFFLGGRTIGPWMTAFAYGTTYFSAVLFIGFAGQLGWGFGINALWISAGNALIGSLLAWLVLARRTRRMTQNLDAMTMPEFLAERFDAKMMKMLAAVIIFLFLLPYTASVFKGLGHLFEASFNISYDTALLIMIGITGVYLVLGGYFAVTLTDFIQGLIMLVCAVVLVVFMTGKAGGLEQALATMATNYQAHIPAAKQPSWIAIASLVFMTSFGVWGMPQMVQKFYAIKDENLIPKAAVITTLFAIVIVFVAYFNGALTHVFFKEIPAFLSQKNGTDMLIPTLLTTHLPPVLLAFILLLVMSASMSTLSSLVLVSASSVAIDLYKGHINPDVSKENSLAMMRFLSGLFVIIAFLIAKFKISIIVTLMSISWGAVAGAFMAPYFYGLYWKGTTKAGAYAGMISGILVMVLFMFFIKLKGLTPPMISSIAMIVPFLVVPLVSWVTQKPEKALVEKAFLGIR